MTRISRSLLACILAECEGQATEICGLLFGRTGLIETAKSAMNVAPDPRRHFELDPAQLIAAHREARKGGPVLMGHYHSHPSGETLPSATDAAGASPDGSLWMIVAESEASLWRAAGEGLHAMFLREELVIDD